MGAMAVISSWRGEVLRKPVRRLWPWRARGGVGRGFRLGVGGLWCWDSPVTGPLSWALDSLSLSVGGPPQEALDEGEWLPRG